MLCFFFVCVLVFEPTVGQSTSDERSRMTINLGYKVI